MRRDKFCEIFMKLGYWVRKIKNYVRTITPVWFDYKNLIEGMAVTAPYHVIQNDITYFDIEGGFYYIVLLSMCGGFYIGLTVLLLIQLITIQQLGAFSSFPDLKYIFKLKVTLE